MNSVGSRIKQIRKDKKLTQVELGQLLGISGAGVGKIETDVSQPTEAAIKLICATYNVNYQWLAFGQEPMYLIPSEDELIIKYAPEADERLKNLFREMSRLPDSSWEAIRDYIAYMLDAVERIRIDHPGAPEP